MSILGNAQTYIGVLATFVVLCLFVSNRNNEKDEKIKNTNGQNNQSEFNNFIFGTLLKLADDLRRFARELVEELKYEVHSIFTSETTKEDSKKDSVKELKEKYPKYSTFISDNRLQASLIQFKFSKEANKRVDESLTFDSIREREELSFVSLYTLFAIIIVLSLDCLDFIALSLRCIFINIFLIVSFEFLTILYHKYTKLENGSLHTYVNINDKVRHPNGIAMWISMAMFFAIWLIAIIPNVISATLSVVFLIIIMALGITLIKHRWIAINHAYNRYTRTFVLSHFTYICIMSGAVSVVLYYGTTIINLHEDIVRQNLWSNTIGLLSNDKITKYFIILFFTANAFILPFLVGWLPIKIKKIKIEKQLRNLQKEFQQIVTQYDKVFIAMQRGVFFDSFHSTERTIDPEGGSQSADPISEDGKP